jgi:tRNA ligase
MGAVDPSVQSQSISHAQAGEGWLRKYLAKLGKDEKDMAQELWDKNWTAIAELCDDNFEEHVLGYPPEKTGLHLHGLNVRSRHFITEDPEVVDDFAESWGFIKTPWTTVNTIKEVRDFTDECAARGEWKGEPVEGFVVRTRVTDVPTSGRGGKETDPARSPYEANSSFFFKVKFDEPYMMYRDWREVTKMLLSSKAYLNPSLLPKSKMKRPETKVYVKWVINEIKKDPEAFKNYTRGKGIIKTRERYLEWLKSDKGEKDLEEEMHKEQEGAAKAFTKTIIVPVAIPGCGMLSDLPSSPIH